MSAWSAERLASLDESFMQAALSQARRAAYIGEVPVGSVLVMEGSIIAEAHNAPVSQCDPSAHAEMLVLREAARRIGSYRLLRATVYTTLEPCPMCAGALVNARVGRLVFAARDLRFGGVRSKFCLADSPLLNHQVEIMEGVLGAEATELLQQFFSARRDVR